MLSEKLKVLRSHGIQYVRDLEEASLPEIFRGRPVITPGIPAEEALELRQMCPSGAIGVSPLSIDLGICLFCGECAIRAPRYIGFTNDHKMATTVREALIIKEGEDSPIELHPENLRPQVRKIFRRALKFRQISAGGDNSNEMELNASGNVNFDFGRYGVDFVASPRHADGIVITGPITASMASPLEICYEAMPSPKIIILAGSEAISGGIFYKSEALERSFLRVHTPDLYLPGNPVHPLTFINGCIEAFISE